MCKLSEDLLVNTGAFAAEAWGKPLISRELSHIGEMRSLVPPSVNMMALTATATTATCQKIVRALCMKRCYNKSPPQKKMSLKCVKLHQMLYLL